MWHYAGTGRFIGRGPRAGTAAQSAYDLLLGLRGAAVSLLYPDPAVPDRTVPHSPGLLEDVRASFLSIGVAAPVPRLPDQARFGVEVMIGPGILRFQTTAYESPTAGATRLRLKLPDRVETVQRRQFTRTPVRMPVIFAPAGTEGHASGSSGVGQALDLSAGGLRLEVPAAIPAGRELYVSFNSPDGASYRGIRARVVRCRTEVNRSEIVLKFLDLPEEIAQDLARTVFQLQMKGPAGR